MGVCQSVPPTDAIYYDSFTDEEREEWSKLTPAEKRQWLDYKKTERVRIAEHHEAMKREFIDFATRSAHSCIIHGERASDSYSATLKLLWSNDVDTSSLEWRVPKQPNLSDICPLNQITRVRAGKHAVQFDNVPHAKVEPWHCFSIETVDAVYAFEVNHTDDQKMWTVGLRMLLDFDPYPADDNDPPSPRQSVVAATATAAAPGATPLTKASKTVTPAAAAAAAVVVGDPSDDDDDVVADAEEEVVKGKTPQKSPPAAAVEPTTSDDFYVVEADDAKQNDNVDAKKSSTAATATTITTTTTKAKKKEEARRAAEQERQQAIVREHQAARDLVLRGQDLMKFCRHAKPHARLFRCTEAGYLDWGTGKLDIGGILTVHRGLSGKALKYVKDLSISERSLSVVHKKRTLDLTAESMPAREQWFMALTDLISEHKTGITKTQSLYVPPKATMPVPVKKSQTEGDGALLAGLRRNSDQQIGGDK